MNFDPDENSLKNDWRLAWRILLKPIVIFPVILSVSALFFANTSESSKSYALILNIIASVALAFAGGFLYDGYKSFTGNTLIIKKGLSAVRNLSLARFKIKNISERAVKGAESVEVSNLLSLLEKDIANATQEWNDILPGVEKIEEMYFVLEESENELKMVEKDKKELDQKLKALSETNASEKSNLKGEIENKDKKIFELSNQIRQLQISTSSLLISASASPFPSASDWRSVSNPSLSQSPASIIGFYGTGHPFTSAKICQECGNSYIPSITLLPEIHAKNLCPDCRGRQQINKT